MGIDHRTQQGVCLIFDERHEPVIFSDCNLNQTTRNSLGFCSRYLHELVLIGTGLLYSYRGFKNLFTQASARGSISSTDSRQFHTRGHFFKKREITIHHGTLDVSFINCAQHIFIFCIWSK